MGKTGGILLWQVIQYLKKPNKKQYPTCTGADTGTKRDTVVFSLTLTSGLTPLQ